MRLPVFLFFLILIKTCCECANILAYIPTASYSHQIPYHQLWQELSLRGHKLTVLTPNPINNPALVNLTEIDLSFTYELYAKYNFTQLWSKSLKEKGKLLRELFDEQFNDQFSHEPVKKLINDKSAKFDLYIMEAQLAPPNAFTWRFQCPCIGVASLDAGMHFHSAAGNMIHPLVTPDRNLPVEDSENMTFFERVRSSTYYILFRLLFLNNHYASTDKLIEKHFGPNVPPVEEIERNISMLFVSTNPVFNDVRPLGPNTIEIGTGMHIKPPKPLPKSFQKFLDKSENGVIYFSLGTNVKGDDLPENLKYDILKVFSELPYNVLWKIDWNATDLPKNVRIEKWMPQQDILRHPNIKLFITQGGLQSLTEAVVNKVPTIGIPFFGDQIANVHIMVKRGYGLKLDRLQITQETLKNTILEVLTNPKYKQKVEELSTLLTDEPETSLQRSIWWIEYVIRHKGAPLLKSHAVALPIWKYLLLDVIAFITTVLSILVYITIKMLKFACKKLCTRKTKTE